MFNALNLRRAKLVFCLTAVLVLITLYYANRTGREEKEKRLVSFQLKQTTLEQKFSFTSKCECKKHLELLVNNLTVYLNDKIKNTQIQLFQFQNAEAFLNQTLTCDAFNSLSKGINQKVVAFSLYGKSSRYTQKLITLVRQVKTMYPGWTMRVYHDNSIDQAFICQIECLKEDDKKSLLIENVVFCNINQIYLSVQYLINSKSVDLSYMHGMLWRYLPVGEDLVEIMSSRDTDSFIIDRELDSVHAWLQSNRFAHIMRDHPSHLVLMMGGMSGFRSSVDRTLSRFLFNLLLDRNISNVYAKNGTYPRGGDQRFLAKYVYNLVKHSALIHDSYNCRTLGGDPWPSKRKGNCFVGNSENCKTQNAEAKLCPALCRPPDHQYWLDC